MSPVNPLLNDNHSFFYLFYEIEFSYFFELLLSFFTYIVLIFLLKFVFFNLKELQLKETLYIFHSRQLFQYKENNNKIVNI